MNFYRAKKNAFVTLSVAAALLLETSGFAVAQRLTEADAGKPSRPGRVSITKMPRAEGETINVSKMSARGVVVGYIGYEDGPPWEGVVRWFWRTRKPRYVGGDEANEGMCTIINRTPLISDDGRVMAAMRLERDETTGYLDCVPIIWTRRSGWQPLPGLVLRSAVNGMSRSGTAVVGYGWNDRDGWRKPWAWSAETGQQVLAVSPDMDGAEAWAIADDGSVVIGHQFQVPYPPDPTEWYYATRWSEDGVRTMTDEHGVPLGEAYSCSSDCSVVVGSGQGGEPDFEHPNWGQAWYWTETTGGVYLGTVPDAAPGTSYYATDVNADGSMIVGTYYVDNGNGTISYRGFLWTAQTGMVRILDILAAYGIDHGSDWDGIIPTAITPSGDMILIGGQEADFTPGGFIVHLPPQWREGFSFARRHSHRGGIEGDGDARDVARRPPDPVAKNVRP